MIKFSMAGRQACRYLPLAIACAAPPARADLQVARTDA